MFKIKSGSDLLWALAAWCLCSGSLAQDHTPCSVCFIDERSPNECDDSLHKHQDMMESTLQKMESQFQEVKDKLNEFQAKLEEGLLAVLTKITSIQEGLAKKSDWFN